MKSEEILDQNDKIGANYEVKKIGNNSSFNKEENKENQIDNINKQTLERLENIEDQSLLSDYLSSENSIKTQENLIHDRIISHDNGNSLYSSLHRRIIRYGYNYEIRNNCNEFLNEVIKPSLSFSVSNFLYSISDFLNVLMIAQLGETQLAASGLALGIKNAVSGAEAALLLATQNMVSIYNGSNDFFAAGSVLQQSWLLGTFSYSFALVLLSQGKFILTNLGVDENISTLVSNYLFPAIPALLLERWNESNILFISSIGKEKALLWLAPIAKAANLITAYSLILGKLGAPKLGIAGAGYAYLVETGLSTLLLTSFLIFGKDFKKFELFNLRFKKNFKQLKQLIKMGMPMFFLTVVQIPISLASRFLISHNLPSSRLALDSIVSQNLIFFNPPINAIMQATSIKVGYLAGSKDFVKMRRIAKIGLLCSTLLSLTIPIGYSLLYKQLYDLFSSNSLDSSTLTNGLLQSVFLCYGIKQIFTNFGTAIVLNSRAIYDVMVPTIIDIVGQLLIGLPLILAASYLHLGDLSGIYLASAIGYLILNICWYLRWNSFSSNTSYLMGLGVNSNLTTNITTPLLQNNSNEDVTPVGISSNSINPKYSLSSLLTIFGMSKISKNDTHISAESNNTENTKANKKSYPYQKNKFCNII